MPNAHDTGIAGEPRYRAITRSNIERRPEWAALAPELREAVTVVSTVLPFRTNDYLLRSLINWERIPDDPIFQLTFPQRGMLGDEEYATMGRLIKRGAPRADIEREANRIRNTLNPHPAGQLTHNVPTFDNGRVPGVQHKYRETVLFFPSNGQTCHAYCTFCFRWPQFVGMDGLKFSDRDVRILCAYLQEHPAVTDVLFTGGDPMIMKTSALARYIEPLLDPALEHIETIRIGTKSVAFWPQRFVTDDDADDVLRLFERIVASGRHLAIMGHYTHPIELSTDIAQEAVRRIRSTGAVIRMQAPLVRHVNDNPGAWVQLWRTGVRLGCVPYYMFVERDTGARGYFAVPLVRAWDIYRQACRRVSGLGRTVRGPSMSALPGKVHIVGVSEINGEKVFVLQYLQARNPKLVHRPFFARFDPDAIWFDELEPVTARDREFFPPARPSEWRTTPLTIGRLTEHDSAP